MTQLAGVRRRTLHEIWLGLEKRAFWAECRFQGAFYCVAISPLGTALGWNEDGAWLAIQSIHVPTWKRIDYKKAATS